MKTNKKKGFTLIELIVVIAILGILAAVLIPKFTGFQDKARRTQVVTDAKQIATALDSLVTESATGAITAATVMDINSANIASNPCLKLAGVPAEAVAGDKTLLYGTDGSFTLTEKINGITYKATRAANAAPVVTP